MTDTDTRGEWIKTHITSDECCRSAASAAWDAALASSANTLDSAALSDLEHLKETIAKREVERMGQDDYGAYCDVVRDANHLIAKLENRHVVAPTASTAYDEWTREQLVTNSKVLMSRIGQLSNSVGEIEKERDAYREALERISRYDEQDEPYAAAVAKEALADQYAATVPTEDNFEMAIEKLADAWLDFYQRQGKLPDGRAGGLIGAAMKVTKLYYKLRPSYSGSLPEGTQGGSDAI